MANKFIFSSSGSLAQGSYFATGSTPGAQFYLTDMSYNETFNKISVTTTNSSGDGTEYISGRAERSFTIDILNDVSSSDIPLNTIFPNATASFEGKRYLGSASLYTKNVVGSIDDTVKSQYEGNFLGAVTMKTASQA